jgi:hypothetical protein
MTTVKAIEEVLKDEPKFSGVFLYDQINKIKRLYDECIIINYITTEEAERGLVGHYVCADNRDTTKGDNQQGLYFFDSFGLEPDVPRSIMGLPDTHNIEQLLFRTNVNWNYNEKQYQVLAPWDELCGIYSTSYVMNPNFETNPIFKDHPNRRLEDERLMKLFTKLKFVNQ